MQISNTKRTKIFIDVIESVNVLVSADGKVLRSDVSGSVMLKAHLSGVPECKFGLNDKILLESDPKLVKKSKPVKGIAIDDCTFHQCVRLSKFDNDRSISFIPPDGEFELMKYRTTQNVKIPFRVFPTVNKKSEQRLEIKVTVKSNFKRDKTGTEVKIKIPVPKNTAVCKVISQYGKAKYTPEDNCVLWKIGRFPGETDYEVNIDLELSHVISKQAKPWNRTPISLSFQVPMWSASGLEIMFLKVIEQKHNYNATKWVRYSTQAGNYQYRL